MWFAENNYVELHINKITETLGYKKQCKSGKGFTHCFVSFFDILLHFKNKNIKYYAVHYVCYLHKQNNV